MKKRTYIYLLILFTGLGLSSCIKDFNIVVKANQPQLVVEGYINNLMRDYNYVILSRSLNYLSTSFQSTPVSNAMVYITEGDAKNGQYVWDASTKTRLVEGSFPQVLSTFTNGIYFDPRIVTNPTKSILGSPGKSYLLEIDDSVGHYSAITTLLQPVPLDSLSSGYRYTDVQDSNRVKLKVTVNYQDPDTLNNTLLFYYRYYEDRSSFGWGGLTKSRSGGTDDLINGQYVRLTNPRGFAVGDTVNYYMASVTRDIYNFWDSYNKARDNNGPFATPVTLGTNLTGSNVTGCFSGFSLSWKWIAIY